MKDYLCLTILFVCLVAWPALSSTQEYLGVVESGSGAGAAVKTVTVMYVSHQVSPGTYEMFDPNQECLFMINDAFCTRDAFLAAVRPGRRLYCRGNRSKGMFYGLYSTPFCEAEGVIASVNGSSFTVTHRPCYRDCTPSTVTQTVTAKGDAVVRYENANVALSDALAPGRHVRVYGSRKQIVQALSPEAWIENVEERIAAWPWTKEGPEAFYWGNEGYFRGVSGATLLLAAECLRCSPTAAGDYIDTYQQGETNEPTSVLIDGQYAPAAAALRPGERCLLVPDRVIDYQSAYKTFVKPGDDGVIEGRLVSVNGSSITLETIACPSGRAADLTKQEVMVTLDGDAAYHLDGVPGAAKNDALQPGSFIRVLPAWSQAVLVRDIDWDKTTVSGDQATVKPWFVSFTPSLTVTEFTVAELHAKAAGFPNPSLTWRRTGSQDVIATGNTYRFIPALSDNGSTFVVTASSAAGDAQTPEITVHVTPDAEPPAIANAFTATKSQVLVAFSKTVSRESAEDVSHYSVDGGVTIHDAILQADGRTVSLLVSDMTRDRQYTLTVNDIQDVASTPNTLASNSTVAFSYGVSFRYLKFTVTERAGSFASELCELRFVVNGQEAGQDAVFAGQLSSGDPAALFDGAMGGGLRWNEGSYVELDFGTGNNVAPEAVKFHTCSDGRYVGAVKAEGSRDGATWMTLVEAAGEFDGAQWHTVAIDLSAINPDDLVAASKPRYGAEPRIPSASGQLICIFTPAGRLVARLPQTPDALAGIAGLKPGAYIVRSGVGNRMVVVHSKQ